MWDLDLCKVTIGVCVVQHTDPLADSSFCPSAYFQCLRQVAPGMGMLGLRSRPPRTVCNDSAWCCFRSDVAPLSILVVVKVSAE